MFTRDVHPRARPYLHIFTSTFEERPAHRRNRPVLTHIDSTYQGAFAVFGTKLYGQRTSASEEELPNALWPADHRLYCSAHTRNRLLYSDQKAQTSLCEQHRWN